MAEIIFSYHGERCHAQIMENMTTADLIENVEYIGKIKGYEIYSTSLLFDSYGFIAVAEEKEEEK